MGISVPDCQDERTTVVSSMESIYFKASGTDLVDFIQGTHIRIFNYSLTWRHSLHSATNLVVD